MTTSIFACSGGTVVLPEAGSVLVDREDGGNLIVNPPRAVWERGELSATELRQWSFLVAATGRAMLLVLPQLEGGCINYWEAGNWALNDAAFPPGRKSPQEYRRVHLHLLGRSRSARSLSWRWGEAPVFPTFAERKTWAATHRRLSAGEAREIGDAIDRALIEKYEFRPQDIERRATCPSCSYPFVAQRDLTDQFCPTCAP